MPPLMRTISLVVAEPRNARSAMPAWYPRPGSTYVPDKPPGKASNFFSAQLDTTGQFAGVPPLSSPPGI
jgi:hypothetical protein